MTAVKHNTQPARTPRGSWLGPLYNDEGVALAITIILLLSLAAMALTAVLVGSTDLMVAGNQRQHSAALDVAEAGVAEALHRLSLRPGEIVNLGNNIDASIQDPSDPPDPNWRARIYLTAPPNAPIWSGSEMATGTVQMPGDFLEYTHENDPARALTITHKLADLDGDGVDDIVLYDSSQVPPENKFTGQPVERILVPGRNGNSRRTVVVEAIRFPISPNVAAGLSSDGAVDLRGNVTVCGHNHRMDTPAGTQLPVCSPNWDEASGHLPAVMTTGDDVDTQGSTDLLGSPVLTDTTSTNPFYSLSQALGITPGDLEDILAGADYTSDAEPGPYEGIMYIQGNASFNGSSGEGLLYVTGDLRLAGNFEWVGMVYVGGDLSNVGNTWILGGVLVEGRTGVAVDFGAGSPAILYSRRALEMALTSAMRYVPLSWREM